MNAKSKEKKKPRDKLWNVSTSILKLYWSSQYYVYSFHFNWLSDWQFVSSETKILMQKANKYWEQIILLRVFSICKIADLLYHFLKRKTLLLMKFIICYSDKITCMSWFVIYMLFFQVVFFLLFEILSVNLLSVWLFCLVIFTIVCLLLILIRNFFKNIEEKLLFRIILNKKMNKILHTSIRQIYFIFRRFKCIPTFSFEM